MLARLPFGMGGVALVIFVHARTGSFGIAGLVTGFYTLAFALAGPLLGRLVDRRGPLPVLRPGGRRLRARPARHGGDRRGRRRDRAAGRRGDRHRRRGAADQRRHPPHLARA